MKYILIRGSETIEVLEGREGRRDQLIAAGYEWQNEPLPAFDVTHVFQGGEDPTAPKPEVKPLRGR